MSAYEQSELTLMQRVALTRLRRFERVAQAAEQSGSALWQELARRSAANAYRDVMLVGLSASAVASDRAGRSEAA